MAIDIQQYIENKIKKLIFRNNKIDINNCKQNLKLNYT